jgi:dTDP-4-amino-4,6-dideoxygalactose transaminase
MRDKFLVFGAPRIEQVEIAEVVASTRRGWLGTGSKVARFEDAALARLRTLERHDRRAIGARYAAMHRGVP